MEDLNKALQIGAVVMTALLIIKGIVDGEDTQVPNAVQEDFNWQNPNLGDLGDRIDDAFRVGTTGWKKS
jgi:hypothetical protein